MTDDSDDTRCRWCGADAHKDAMTGKAMGMWCPLVRAFNFNDFGRVSRVEFLTPRDCASRTEAQDDGEPYPTLGNR